MGKEVILGLGYQHTERAKSLQKWAGGDIYLYGDVVNQEMREEGNARLAKFSRRLTRDMFGEAYGLGLYGAGFAYDSLSPLLKTPEMSKGYIWKSEARIHRHVTVSYKDNEARYNFEPIQKMIQTDSPDFFEDLYRQIDNFGLNECETIVVVGALSLLLPVYLRRRDYLRANS